MNPYFTIYLKFRSDSQSPNLTSHRYVKKKGQRLGKQSDNVRIEMSGSNNCDDAKQCSENTKEFGSSYGVTQG